MKRSPDAILSAIDDIMPKVRESRSATEDLDRQLRDLTLEAYAAGVSIPVIAEHRGCNHSAVWQTIQRHNGRK